MVYVNGKMLPKDQASINVFDHGLLYGDGVFEGIRVYKGRIFKLQQHMDRLYSCAKAIRIDLEKHVSRDEMIAIQRRCIETNELVDGYIRLVVTRGVGTLGLHPFRCPEPGVVCIADQISLYPPELYQNGMRVVIAERPRIPVECLDPGVKSLNYLNNILAKIEAIDAGCLECIMLNIEGHVCEGSGDNIFLVKDGEMFTPPLSDGLLGGVTRRFVMESLAPLAGIDVTERHITRDDLFAADEIFLTGTAAEVIAVTRIGKDEDSAHVVGSGQEGPITKSLRLKFRQVVTGDSIPED
ncbi:MAG TPA: branched-chain-amino-acid transaminase [Phycisphaerales bacterium]|nr:branched-chain-amino-acid transaminase [Phycisphaerales bacterium]